MQDQLARRVDFPGRAVAAFLLLAVFSQAAYASTESSLGDPGGEGAGPFGGFQQSAEANLYTGAFTLSVPIAIPPGRPQLTPALQLKYSSSDGDGPFGRGWTLPLGQVQRNSKRGVPRCNGASTDDFSVVLNGTAHELVWKTGNTYRPRIDSGFLEATKNTAANTWEVVDRGGRRYRFGTVPDARLWIDTDTFLNSSTCAFTSVWGLTAIEDSFGNLIEITYAPNLDYLVPEKVEYGGTASLPHPFQIQFVTATHPNPPISYRLGVKERLERLVVQVIVEARLSQGADFDTIRIYDLAYNHQGSFPGCANAHKALLCRVSADDGRPAETFEYTTSAVGLGLTTMSTPSLGGNLRKVSTGSDIVRSVMDMNGDGLTDLVDADDLGNDEWKINFGTTGGISTDDVSWLIPTNTGGSLEGEKMRIQTGYNNGISRTIKETIDLTGDGIPDFVDGTLSTWKVYPGYCSTTCGFSSSPILWPGQVAEVGENQKDQGGDRIRVWKQLIDMNGDGRPDLLRASATQWLVHLNTGSGFAAASPEFTFTGPISEHLTSNGETRVTRDLFDVTGDGLPDVVWSPNGSEIWLDRNTGQGFEASVIAALHPGPDFQDIRRTKNEDNTARVDFVDVNADGLPDHVEYNPAWSSWRVRVNRGATCSGCLLASWIPWPGGSQGPIRDQNIDGATKVDLLDYNGDGFADRVDATGSAWTIKLGGPSASLPKVRPLLLVRANNGLGGATHVRYAPSTHFANEVLPFITWVVTGIRRTDGLCVPPTGVDLFTTANTCIGAGHELVQAYEYEGGRFDGVDREFRGFEKVITTGPDGNTVEVTYSQDDLTRGMKLLQETFAGPDPVVRDTYTWGTQADGPRTQIYLKEQKRELLSVPSDPLLNQCSYDRNHAPDEYGRISTSCSLDCTGAPSTPGSCANPTIGQITTSTNWADPESGWTVRERPSSVKTEYKSASGSIVKLVEKFFRYDGAELGVPLEPDSVTRGALTWVESHLDQSPLGSPSNPIVLRQVDSFGNVVMVRDPLGNDTTFNFAASPYSLFAATTTNALSHQTATNMHLGHGKPLSETGSNGDVTNYTYDAMGRLLCEALPGDSCSGGAGPTRTFSYHTPTGGGFEAALSYVEMRLEEPAHASGYRTSRVYLDALGRERLSTIERIVGSGTTLSTVVVGHEQYDAVGRVARAYFPYVKSGSISESPTAAFTSYDYELNGLGVLDPLGRPHIIAPPDGNATTILFKGRRTQVFDVLNNETRVERDAFGREITRDLYDQGTLRMRQDYRYDGLGRMLSQTVYATPASRGGPSTVTTTYDTLGRDVRRVDPDSGTWRFGYDAMGNLVFEDDPKTGQHVQVCYDAIGRATKRYVLPASDEYLPTACSLASPEATFSYDNVSGGNKGIGRLTSASDASGSESWTYDLRGNILTNSKTVLGKTAVLGATYDAADRLQNLTYFGTEQVTYAYRADGYPRSLTSGSTTYVSDAGFDIFGRLELLRHGNGTDDTIGFYGAAEGFRIQRITTTRSGVTTPYLDLQYQYDERGLVERIDDLRNPTTDLSNSAIYTYDGLGRLTSFDWLAGMSHDDSFSYDNVGNLTSLGGASLSYPGKPHQALTRSDGTEMLYDSNGSRISKETSAETFGYVYDGLGRLSTVDRSLTPTDPPTKTVQLTYDAGSDLVARVVTANGTAGPPRRFFNRFIESYSGTATKYYHFAGRQVASQDVSTTALSEAPPGWVEPRQPPGAPVAGVALALGLMLLLLWSPWRGPVHIGVRVSSSRATGVVLTLLFASIPVLMGQQCGGPTTPPVRHFHLDHLGSLQSVSDGAGSLWRQARYGPFGDVRGRFNAAGTSAALNEKARQEFIGYQTEFDADLDYAYARFYDPELGQFLSHDPMAEFPSPYAYTHGDPINFSDPSGALVLEAGLILGGLLLLTQAIRIGVNYARTGDWDFALDPGNGIQTPAPGAGTIVGPIQSDACVYQGAQVCMSLTIDPAAGADPAFEFSGEELTALRAAIEAAKGSQGNTRSTDTRPDPNYVWDFGWIKILGSDPNVERQPHEGWLEGALSAVPLSQVARWLGLGGRGALKTTVHGAERVAGKAATRGGVLNNAQIAAVRASGRLMRQADGATVRILEQQSGRFNVVVEGKKGVITTFENLSQKALDRLARNYGWY